MKTPTIVTLALFIAIAPRAVQAQALRTWTATPSGSWATGANWSASTAPVAGDSAFIMNSGTATISTEVATGRVRVGVSGTGAGHLFIESGGKLTLTLDSSVNYGGSVTVAGVLTSSAQFNVANSVSNSGTVTIQSTGTMSVSGQSGNTSNFRVGGAGSTATVNVDGGYLSFARAVRIGGGDNANATLTLKNGGTIASTASGVIGLGGNADGSYSGVTSTFNIGGATDAEAAGYLRAFGSVNGFQGSGDANTNTVNFNHTSARYEFIRANDQGSIALLNGLAVDLKAGVTVLSSSSNYTGETNIRDGAVLLANYETSTVNGSSTGQGTVSVEEGGTLGGLGWVNGATTVAGTLKPGDYDYGRATATHGVLKFRDDLILESTSTTLITLGSGLRGAGYNAIDVGGELTLDGTLAIELWNTFNIALNQTLTFDLFNVVDDNIQGSYQAFDLVTEWNGLTLNWDVTGLSEGGFISVTAVPEPSSLLLLLGAGVAGLVCARHRNGKLA